MNQDIKILRELANRYAQIAAENNEKGIWNLHANLNDLHPSRPIAFFDELPWHELNIDGSLTLQCQDPYFRELEDFLRKTIFQYQYFPGDMIIKPYLPVKKIVHTTGFGMEIKEETLATDQANDIVSHRYINQFESMEDIEKLHRQVITYDKDASMERFWKVCEAVGDLIPVKLTGHATGYRLGHIAWDHISQFMNTEDLLYNLVDEPELMHALVERLTDIFMDTMRQYEALNLLDADAGYCHCAAASSRDLMKEPVDYNHVKMKNVWGRGLAQILATVSPAMHEEFEIEYAKKSLAPFGLVYYGCCEPLDTKIDVIKKITNLRKISITPWADIHRAAEAVGRDYVISAKPNPANLPYAVSNPELIRSEIRNILNACEKNGTPCEIILKDISTSGNNLENLVVWNRIVKEEIEN